MSIVCKVCQREVSSTITRAGPAICAECYFTPHGLQARIKWLESKLPVIERAGGNEARTVADNLLHGLRTMKHYEDTRADYRPAPTAHL